MSALMCALLSVVLFCFGGCGVNSDDEAKYEAEIGDVQSLVEDLQPADSSSEGAAFAQDGATGSLTTPEIGDSTSNASFDLSSVPEYDGSPTAVVNGDVPFFASEEFLRGSFEEYSPLDGLGRCGPAMALVGTETMPTGKRENISEIKPTGWQTPNPHYDFIVGGTLYNRSHLLAFHLTGENANAQNLITGTRTMNQVAMQPLENEVGDYVEATGLHVLMRVTPVFEGNNLVASGVLMEAQSVEDGGKGIRFCRWCYNIEPGVVIDYVTGASRAEDVVDAPEASAQEEVAKTYVLNTKSRKFHNPDCRGVATMADKNKQSFTGTRSELIEQGYSPCGTCKP